MYVSREIGLQLVGSLLHYIITEAYSGRRKGKPYKRVQSAGVLCIEYWTHRVNSQLNTRHPTRIGRREVLHSGQWGTPKRCTAAVVENHSLSDCVSTVVWTEYSVSETVPRGWIRKGRVSAKALDLEIFLPNRMDLSVVCGRFVNKVEELYRIDKNHVLGR